VLDVSASDNPARDMDANHDGCTKPGNSTLQNPERFRLVLGADTLPLVDADLSAAV
jgi:hypothetical protein